MAPYPSLAQRRRLFEYKLSASPLPRVCGVCILNFSHTDYASPDSWVHEQQPLLGQNRCTLHEPPDPKEDKETKELPAEHEEIAEDDRLQLAVASDDAPSEDEDSVSQ